MWTAYFAETTDSPIVVNAAPRLKVIAKWGTGMIPTPMPHQSRHARLQNRMHARSGFGSRTRLQEYSVHGPAMKRGGIKYPDGLEWMTVGVVRVGAIEGRLERARPFGAMLLGNDIRTVDD